MLSINTNISSLIAQESMKSSTTKLDQAIERMTTGFKINHAKDNAANYSISTNMTTQLSAYDVAADNVAMGMDMVNTASDIISQMQDKGERLRALATQARNGTYGQRSLDAINAEAHSLLNELSRLYTTSEYNGIDLFKRKEYELSAEHKALTETVSAKAEYNGFIADPKSYSDEYVETLTPISDVVDSFDKTIYKISNELDLAHLAKLTNDGIDTSGITFVLAKDIDLKAWCAEHSDDGGWVPIGNSSHDFNGNFNGNGHVIKNLSINNQTADHLGLFGNLSSSATIENFGVINVEIIGNRYLGCIAGLSMISSNITNVFAKGSIKGNSNIGGILGGQINDGNIESSYAEINILATGESIGGLVGSTSGPPSGLTIRNCYTKAILKGQNKIGGLVGHLSHNSAIINCYSDSNSNAQKEVGGLVGMTYNLILIQNSYVKGNIFAQSSVGGIVGELTAINQLELKDVVSYAKVGGNSIVGDFIGKLANTEDGVNFSTINIDNCAIINNNEIIGEVGKFYLGSYSTLVDYDKTILTANIGYVELNSVFTELQIGTYGNNDCRLSFNTNFDFDLSIVESDISTDEALRAIDDFTSLLSEKSTQLGAVQNRLDSALESIQVNIDNLTSSRSTIRDADIAEVSAEYIQQQILQQASATLMATANQSPSIALQLI